MHQLSHNMHTKAVRWLSTIHKYTLGVHLMCWLTPRATWLSLIGPTESPHPINSVRRRCCCEMQHTSKLLHSHCKHGAAVSCYADPSLQAQSAQLGTTLEYRELNMHIYIYVRESALLFCPLWRDAERCWLLARSRSSHRHCWVHNAKINSGGASAVSWLLRIMCRCDTFNCVGPLHSCCTWCKPPEWHRIEHKSTIFALFAPAALQFVFHQQVFHVGTKSSNYRTLSVITAVISTVKWH
jgi:hypothetical protein